MTTDNSTRRSSLLKKNIAMSFLIKAWSAIVVFVMVPVTLNCLGEYKNGVWLTISSMMLWIDNMDIGLGNGMRNKLAIYMAHDDIPRARILISSAFAMLTIITIPIMLLLVAFIISSDTYQLLNIDSSHINDLDSVLIVTCILACSAFVFKLIGNFYMGIQLPAVSNMLISLGQTIALIGTFIIYKNGDHSLLHIAIINTASPLIVYIIAYIYTFSFKFPYLKPSIKLFCSEEVNNIIGTGIQFFVIQIATVILFMTSNILISKLFTPALVTPFQVTYRYFSIVLVIFNVIYMPFWNATTDAYERGDIEWIRQATRRLRIITIGIALGMFVMILCSDLVYSIWVGDGIVTDVKMSIMMAIYIFILIYSMRYSYFINGIGKLRLQLIFSVAAAIMFVPTAYFVANTTNDIIWFMVVMCVVNTPGMIVNRIQFTKLINKKAKGIWNK